jgi:hypothetical protein
MRIRTIKPEFFTHEALFDAETETGLPLRVAFVGLWCAADREGRFRWEPRRLKVQILPYDELDFSRVLDALTTRAFIVKYRVGDAWFAAIPSWTRHQFINNRESSSEIPDISESEQLDACDTREPRVNHACQGEGKGREGNKEGKGREGKEAQAPAPSAPLPFASPDFSEAWTDFQKHRTEIRKPLKPTSSKAALRELQAMGEPRAIAALRHTVAKGWQGIREPEHAAAHAINGANRHQMPEATAEDHAKGFYHGLDDEPAPARPTYAHAT